VLTIAIFTCRDKEEKKKAILEQHVNMTQKQEEMRVIDGKKVPQPSLYQTCASCFESL
jgi:hypothetical protein